MTFTSTNFAVNFSPISDIKKKFINNANLEDQFADPTILPIPDNAPDDIPRIVCQSKNGHSNLTITKCSLSLSTMYDNSYLNDWSLCRSYLSNKIHLLLDILDKLECDFKFSGLVTQIICEPSEDNATNELLHKFSKVKSNYNIYDYSQRFTIIKDEKYFVNLEINNIRVFNGATQNLTTAGFLKDEEGNKICIVSDVNDRYDFNYNVDFKSDSNKINKLLDLTDKCISNIDTLVNNAEVTL